MQRPETTQRAEREAHCFTPRCLSPSKLATPGRFLFTFIIQAPVVKDASIQLNIFIDLFDHLSGPITQKRSKKVFFLFYDDSISRS